MGWEEKMGDCSRGEDGMGDCSLDDTGKKWKNTKLEAFSIHGLSYPLLVTCCSDDPNFVILSITALEITIHHFIFLLTNFRNQNRDSEVLFGLLPIR